MDSTAFWLAFQSQKLPSTGFEQIKSIFLSTITVIFDFFISKYMYEFIQDKNASTYLLWFACNSILTILFNPIKNKSFEPDKNIHWLKIGYIIIYVLHCINTVIAVLIPFPSPPAELILAISFNFLSFFLSAVQVFMEIK